jgi:aryl-phospho-beta-D-glucosidase BglC (GH1 family)
MNALKNVLQLSSYKVVFTFLITLSISLTSSAQGFLKVDGKQIVNEKGENILLRGMGLGGWMLQEGYMLRVNGGGQQHKIRARIEELVGSDKTQEFYDAWLNNHTRKIDIDSMKRWGFNSVRLPMHYNLYTLPIEKEPVPGEQTWLTKGFAMTDNLLAWCKANNMYLILDLHATPGGQGNDLNISDRDPAKPSLWESEQNKQKMIALWRKLAERYANEPWIGGYDLINEPNWGFEDLANDKNGLKEQKNEPLKKLMQDVTSAIREVDKKHIIIIEGNGWGNNYNGILPTWDNNMVLSFHKYWNYNDQKAIQHMLDTREKYNVPIWLGETGENSNVWFTQAITLLEKNNIGWAWWPLKKLGGNNPLEVKSNSNYDQIIKYWRGEGPKPDATTAYNGLKEVSNALKFENNIVHHDVIDAMFRQTTDATAKPFKTLTIANNSILNLVDYDLGRNAIAYLDNDTANYYISGGPRGGNHGHNYRNDGVDIYLDSAATESYYIGNTEAGEWVQYSVNVLKEGKYTFRFMVASNNADGKISVGVDNAWIEEKVSVPRTDGLKKWQSFDVKDINLKKGKQVIKIKTDTGGFNMKSVQFVSKT